MTNVIGSSVVTDIEALDRTFSPMDDREKLLQKLEHIASELESDMSRNGWVGKTVTLKYKLDTYQGKFLSCWLALRLLFCDSIHSRKIA